MKIADYKKNYEEFSGKLSDINRSIAFAGIGLIWIFTNTAPDKCIPDSLVFPAIMLAGSLALDMLQYFFGTIIWYKKFRRHEKESLNKDAEFEHSIWLTRPGWILWFLKIICVFIAYGFIIAFLTKTLVA